MNIYRNILIVDLGLFVDGVLVITDTQIGYEESLNKQGIMIPRMPNELMKRLERIIEIAKPSKIVINGDVKHEFGTISESEWRNVSRLVDFLVSKAELVLVKGNHDTVLGPIAAKKNVIIRDYYCIGDIYLCHGHQIPEDEDFRMAKTVIIGHEHPAVALRDNGRVERFKCFLKGKYKDKVLIVQPSFNLLTEGTDVLSEKLLSPFLQHNIKDFEIFIAAEKPLYFGKISQL
jgi:uncharacterized protein